MSSAIITKYLSEEDYNKWNEFISQSPDSSIYSTPEYLDTLCEAGGGKFKILAAFKGDEIVGGVGLYERESYFGTYISTRLLLYYNGIVLQDCQLKYPSQRTSRHLKIMSALEETLSKAGYASLELKNCSNFTDARVFLARGWSTRLTYTYVIDCSNVEQMWDRIEQNIRRLIKRSTEQDIQFSVDDDFESLYRLHLQTHERKGSPLYLPHKQFKGYFERLKSKNLCRLYHARLPDGKSISAQLVLLGPHSASYSVCAGTDEEHLTTGATAFLRWKACEDLSKLGYVSNDLTDAALNPVTRFKSQLGANLQTSLILCRPESFAFRHSRSLQNIKSRTIKNVANFVKKIIGKEIKETDFSYWQ